MEAPKMMRYFTRQWLDGELSDADYENSIASYERRLQFVSPLLPSVLREFVSTMSLHDALVRRAVFRRADGSLLLLLRAGDLQKGYVDLTLRYLRVSRLDGVPSPASVLAADGAEIVQDEVDVSDTGDEFEHRLLFAPEGELGITFGGFEFDVAPAHDRSLNRGEPAVVFD